MTHQTTTRTGSKTTMEILHEQQQQQEASDEVPVPFHHKSFVPQPSQQLIYCNSINNENNHSPYLPVVARTSENMSKPENPKKKPLIRLFKKTKAPIETPLPPEAPSPTVIPPESTVSAVVPKLTVPPPPKKPVGERIDGKRSWLCRTKMFKEMVANAFELVDQDGSGTIDEKELYSGLLLIHLNLGSYAGPAACKPISREKCHSVFVKMDSDGSGHLDRGEFEGVMMVLFGNVMMRIAIQYACTLLIVPVIAQAVLMGFNGLVEITSLIILTLDEHNFLELALEHVWRHALHFWSSKLPSVVHHAGDVVQGWVQSIPDSVWNTIPVTLLSTVLSLMLVPWSLLQIDDFFQRLAEKSNAKAKEIQKKKA